MVLLLRRTVSGSVMSTSSWLRELRRPEDEVAALLLVVVLMRPLELEVARIGGENADITAFDG